MALPVQIRIANDTFSRFFSCSFTNMKKGVRKIAVAVPFLLLLFFFQRKRIVHTFVYFLVTYYYVLFQAIMVI